MTTKVEKTITVDVPVSTAYNQWTQFEEFPEFMSGVKQVEQLDDQRLHWVAEIAGVKREWYATIVDQRADERVAWAATDGATNAGAVSFSSAGPSSTVVTLELEYEPEGLIETIGDKLNIVEKQAESDLEKFKSFIEDRQTETGGWRGDVAGTSGTPGVEDAAGSQGDSGKAGVAAKTVAGVAAAAVGVAAAATAAGRSGDDQSEQAETVTTPPQTTSTDSTSAGMSSSDMGSADTSSAGMSSGGTTMADSGSMDSSSQVASDDMLSNRTNLETAPVGAPDDAYGRSPGNDEDLLTDDVELDSSTPGITDANRGNA